MRVLSHPMATKDVQTCVELLAAHPVERHRYGQLLKCLPNVWKNLLRSESIISSVMRDEEACPSDLRAYGVSAFVTDEFLRRCKTPHPRWIGRELVQQISGGDSPVLTAKGIREANSRDGLNLVAWAGHVRPVREEDRIRWLTELSNAFMQEHRGFRLKEAVTQPVDAVGLRVVLNSGPFLWCSGDGCYKEAGDLNLEKLVRSPFIVGINRELAIRYMGTWTSTLFLYSPPRIYFRPAEQTLLRSALKGLTDEELSNELGVSLSFVKKTWHSVYERSAEKVLDLHLRRTDGSVSQRGKEKKQRVLAYLRSYPEELRPISRSIYRK